MRTSFWRFAYDEDRLHDILGSNDLVFPDLSHWPLAKNKNETKIISDLKEGNYVLLANFNRTNEIGTVKGVGEVVRINTDGVKMKWKRPIPSWSLTPNAQGGVQEWIKEGVFCFDAEPAKRYKLQARASKLFASHNQ
jgi:hypothetical protein